MLLGLFASTVSTLANPIIDIETNENDLVSSAIFFTEAIVLLICAILMRLS